MARRRRRNTSNQLIVTLFLGVVGAGMVISAVQYILSSTTVQVFLTLGLLGGGTAYVVRVAQRKKKRLEARRLWAIRAQAADGYLSMSPGEFERALAFLCERDGCHGVKVVGGAGDLGADVIATTPNGARLVIQAKRYAPRNMVTGPDLQKFGGTCYAVHRAGVAAVVTTSGFTRQAQDYAGHMKIKLFGTQALGAWASRTGPSPWLS